MFELFTPFTTQSRLAHLGLVVAGVLSFVGGTYATAIVFYDGTATFGATGSAAIAARRASFTVGMVCCLLVFLVGTLRAIGGPALNVLYPPLIFGVSIGVAYPLLFGANPDLVLTEGSPFSMRSIRDHMIVFLPGGLLTGSLFLLALYVAFDSEEEQREWMAHNLSDSFLEAYHPEYENGTWLDEPRE